MTIAIAMSQVAMPEAWSTWRACRDELRTNLTKSSDLPTSCDACRAPPRPDAASPVLTLPRDMGRSQVDRCPPALRQVRTRSAVRPRPPGRHKARPAPREPNPETHGSKRQRDRRRRDPVRQAGRPHVSQSLDAYGQHARPGPGRSGWPPGPRPVLDRQAPWLRTLATPAGKLCGAKACTHLHHWQQRAIAGSS